MGAFPKVAGVRPLASLRLAVTFDNGVTRHYDCAPLLKHPAFAPLADPSFFRHVTADPHGFGVVWSDTLDLAESELWVNGASAEPGADTVTAKA
jgi:hypothetical protein